MGVDACVCSLTVYKNDLVSSILEELPFKQASWKRDQCHDDPVEICCRHGSCLCRLTGTCAGYQPKEPVCGSSPGDCSDGLRRLHTARLPSIRPCRRPGGPGSCRDPWRWFVTPYFGEQLAQGLYGAHF